MFTCKILTILVLLLYGDSMSYKNIFKRETRVIAIAAICMAVVLIGGSFALFVQVNHNQNNQVVEAGSLVIEYSNGNTVDLTNTSMDDESCLTPKDDVSGAGNGGCQFTFTVHNRGSLPMNYDLTIFNDTSSLPSGGSFVEHNYIKNTLIKQVGEASGVALNSAKLLSTLETDGEGKKVLEKQAVIQPNETVRYTLNIWIDENAPVDIIGKYVYLNYGVSGVVEDGEAILSDN